MLEEGDWVVPISTKNTEPIFSINRLMIELVENKRKIKVQEVRGNRIDAGGWSWNIKDLKPAGKRKPKCPKAEYFSTDMLME